MSVEADVEIDNELLIPVGDEQVAAARYSPKSVEGPLPALLMYIPYHKDDFISYGGYHPLILYLAEAGYEVIVADMVGTGASSGVKKKPFDAGEGQEAVEIIEWLAVQEWTTGDIGMFGKSYGGITALKAAAEQPDALKAIVPTHAPWEMYDWGELNFHGGQAHWTPLMQALQAMPPTHRDSEGRWADVWQERLDGLREHDPWQFQWLSHDTYDEYWKGMDIAVDRIEIPTFTVSGWRDGFPSTTEEFFEQIDAPKHMLLGPWRHTMPHRGRECAINFRSKVVEWFDSYLKDRDTDVENWPQITYWTELAGGGKPDAGIWRSREKWPKVAAGDESLSFILTGEGLKRDASNITEPVDAEYEHDHTVGIHSFDQGLPLDTSPDDVRSLTFDSSPLSTPVELTGNGEVTLRLTSTIDHPVAAVRVIDVSPNGSSQLVTHGQVHISERERQDLPTSFEAGEELELTFPLKAKSHIFESGHQIRVAISGAFFPIRRPPNEQGSFTIKSSQSHPSLVKLPGKERDELNFDETPMKEPDQSFPPEPTAVIDANSNIEIDREFTNDRLMTEVVDQNVTQLPEATMEYEHTINTTVLASDPSTAKLKKTTKITLEYPTETIVVDASSQVGQEIAQANTTITVDDAVIFDETWVQ